MADPVSTNIQNHRPAIEATNNGCVFIATRYLPGGSGLYQVVVYKKCPGDSSFTPIVVHQEEVYLDGDFVNY